MISPRIDPSGSISATPHEAVHVVVDPADERRLRDAAADRRLNDDPADHFPQACAGDSSLVNELEADVAAPVGAQDVGGSLTGGSFRRENVEETTSPLIRGNGRREGSRINFRCGGPFGRWNHGRDAFVGAGAGQVPGTSRSFGFKIRLRLSQETCLQCFLSVPRV